MIKDAGSFIANYGLYTDNGVDFGAAYMIPYYLCNGQSGSLAYQSSGTVNNSLNAYDHIEHTYDVASIMLRARHYMVADGDTIPVDWDTKIKLMLNGMEWEYGWWHRDGQATIDAGKMIWRISPARKLNWMYYNGFSNPYLAKEAGI